MTVSLKDARDERRIRQSNTDWQATFANADEGDASMRSARLEQLLRRTEQSPASFTPSLGWNVFAAGIVLASLLLALGWALLPGQNAPPVAVSPLNFELADGLTQGPKQISAGATSGRLVFSDGSKIELEPGSALAIQRVTNKGARIQLVKGQTRVAIAHRTESTDPRVQTKRDWDFIAGPFLVHVTGTRFDTRWDGEELSVALHEGGVLVTNVQSGATLQLAAGQQLRADVKDGSLRLSSPLVEKAVPPKPKPEVEGEQSALLELQTSAKKRPIKPGTTATEPKQLAPGWSQLVRNGQFEEVLQRAERLGLASCWEHCSTQELRALADAARYLRQAKLAITALTHLQRKGSRTERATAVFLLARTSESVGQTSQALHWFDSYLAEAPNGRFASEALAGRCSALEKLGKSSKARAAAKDYLRAYPKGTFAARARQLLE